MKPRHAAALALVGLLSSCASIHHTYIGPSPDQLRLSEQEYKVCMQTSDYPTGECAKEERWNNELHALDFRTD
jgi:hypothetical protein